MEVLAPLSATSAMQHVELSWFLCVQSPQLFRNIGAFLGRTDAALSTFSPPTSEEARPPGLWDLRCAAATLAELLPGQADADQRWALRCMLCSSRRPVPISHNQVFCPLVLLSSLGWICKFPELMLSCYHRPTLEWVQRQHEIIVAPAATTLRRGWLHGDGNEDNILVRVGRMKPITPDAAH